MASGVAPISPVALDWTDLPERRWNAFLARAHQPALEQSWAYGTAFATLAAGHGVERCAIRQCNETIGVLQVLTKERFAGLRLGHILRGPAWLAPPDATTLDATFRAVRSRYRWRRGAVLLWMPDLPFADSVVAAMRGAGMRRVMTGYHTAWVDLARDDAALRAGLAGKWRNLLVKAENSGIRVRATNGAGADADWLIGEHDAFRRARRHKAPDAAALHALLATGRRSVLTLVALRGKARIAGVMLVGHGSAATYHVGWTGPEGRQAAAHNLLLWQAMLRLRDAGHGFLDVGGLNTTGAPGVAHFKLGLGGVPVTLAGTFM